LHEKRSPVTASVVKGAEFLGLVAENQDLLGADGKNPKCPGADEVTGTTDVDPVSIPNFPKFPLVVVGIQIKVRRKCRLHSAESVVTPDGLTSARHFFSLLRFGF